MIEDLESVLSDHAGASDFSMALVKYADDEFKDIRVDDIGAFDWDDDDEFFLVPVGSAQYYNLSDEGFSAADFLSVLKEQSSAAVRGFEVYARSAAKILADGSVASVNSPIWGTGIHQDARLVYFYHGRQPDAS